MEIVQYTCHVTPILLKQVIASAIGGRRGSGLVDVMYLDETVRVFRDSRGGVAVQIRADKLQS